MKYTLKCDKCDFEETAMASIHDGPPENLPCAMCKEGTMYNQLGTNFILRGDGWTGKNIKRNNEEKAAEALKEAAKQRRSDQELSNAVLAERRKGRVNWERYQKNHPDKVKRYKENLSRGIKGDS
jgi:hypothetical protein